MAIASISHSKDMQEYMQETHDLINMEEYEEALERTIWFHNHALEHDSSMYGVRLSFALMYWKDFGDKYPPALVALKDIRDKNTGKLLAGEGSPELLNDVEAINRTLSEKDKTIDLFHRLDKEKPELAKRSWHYIKDTIIKSGNYELVKKYIGNLLVEYTRQEVRFIQMNEFYENNKEKFGRNYMEFAHSHYLEKTSELIGLAKELKDTKAEEEITKRASRITEEYGLIYDFSNI